MFRVRQSKTIMTKPKLSDYFQVGHLYEIEIKSYENRDIPEITKAVLVLKNITKEHNGIDYKKGTTVMLLYYLDDLLEKTITYLYRDESVQWLKRIS